MSRHSSDTIIRVRYSETDQMGTFYNSRVLEWFECGRTEFLRSLDTPYAQMEKHGIFLPLIESYVKYLGRAQYDDELRIVTSAALNGRARLRFDLHIEQKDDDKPVAQGYTVHAITDAKGKPIRPPAWLNELFMDKVET